MAYRNNSNETVGAEISRVWAEELAALESLMPMAAGATGATVHRLRVFCKRLRALLRLLPKTDARRSAERLLRDLARGFGPARDARVNLQLAASIAGSAGPGDAATPAMQWLAERLQAVEAVAEKELPVQLETALTGLGEIDLFTTDLDLHSARSALERSARRIRHAREALQTSGDAEDIHVLRQCVKRWALQLELTGRATGAAEPVDVEGWQLLSHELGEVHDAGVLLSVLDAAPSRLRSDESLQQLREHLLQYCAVTREQALSRYTELEPQLPGDSG